VLLSLRPDGMYQDNNERENQGPPKRRKTNASTVAETPAAPSPGNGTLEIKSDGETVKPEDAKNGVKEEEEKEEEEEIKNKFDEIPPSRTFLTTVSAKKCLIDWLDVDPMIQAALSRKDEHGMQGRMPEDPNFPPYGMMQYGHMNFPGGPPPKQGEDPRGRNGGMPGEQLMNGGRFPQRPFGQQDMLAGQMVPFDGSHMSPRMPYGGFPSPQDMMQFEAMNNMPRVPRHSGEMPPGNMPFDGQHGMPRMPWFNQSDMASQIHFDRMSRGAAGQDLMQSQVPPHMWPMANQFMRGNNGGGGSHQGGGGGSHQGGGGGGGGGGGNHYGGNPMPNNGSSNGHEGDMPVYGGQQGYPPHPGQENGGMMGGGGGPNVDGGGGPPPQQQQPQRPPLEKEENV